MERWRRSAYLMCQDWHTADDLVSIAIAKIYRHWRDVRGADNPEAYAQKILTRTWLSERRRPWRRERSAEHLPDQPVDQGDRIIERDALAGLLRQLGPRQRAVLILRFYFDYSAEQTAEILQVTGPASCGGRSAGEPSCVSVCRRPPSPSWRPRWRPSTRRRPRPR